MNEDFSWLWKTFQRQICKEMVLIFGDSLSVNLFEPSKSFTNGWEHSIIEGENRGFQSWGKSPCTFFLTS
jgi:hypothetical protein